MKTFVMMTGVAALAIGSPAAADHAFHLGVPYDSRGECESTMAEFRNGDRDLLLENFPQFFQTPGDVNSFLSRAFTCELNAFDGAWYIRDHRREVLTSDWFLKRQR